MFRTDESCLEPIVENLHDWPPTSTKGFVKAFDDDDNRRNANQRGYTSILDRVMLLVQ